MDFEVAFLLLLLLLPNSRGCSFFWRGFAAFFVLSLFVCWSFRAWTVIGTSAWGRHTHIHTTEESYCLFVVVAISAWLLLFWLNARWMKFTVRNAAYGLFLGLLGKIMAHFQRNMPVAAVAIDTCWPKIRGEWRSFCCWETTKKSAIYVLPFGTQLSQDWCNVNDLRFCELKTKLILTFYFNFFFCLRSKQILLFPIFLNFRIFFTVSLKYNLPSK